MTCSADYQAIATSLVTLGLLWMSDGLEMQRYWRKSTTGADPLREIWPTLSLPWFRPGTADARSPIDTGGLTINPDECTTLLQYTASSLKDGFT